MAYSNMDFRNFTNRVFAGSPMGNGMGGGAMGYGMPKTAPYAGAQPFGMPQAPPPSVSATEPATMGMPQNGAGPVPPAVEGLPVEPPIGTQPPPGGQPAAEPAPMGMDPRGAPTNPAGQGMQIFQQLGVPEDMIARIMQGRMQQYQPLRPPGGPGAYQGGNSGGGPGTR